MLLKDLAATKSERDSEFYKRIRRFEEKTVTHAEIGDLLSQGWLETKSMTDRVKVRRPRSIGQLLEDRFWCCLYKLGYAELNAGRNFKVPIGDKASKQIDVFAKDAETVIVAECKSSAELSRRSLQKDLGDFHANKRPIADAIRKHYGKEFKPKIIWLFVIQNISITQEDIGRAKE